MVNWTVSKTEARIIEAIALRAVELCKKHRVPAKYSEFDMDITACHANGCELKLEELRDADDFNFTHDVFGIRKHINRENGKLENCFLPRFAVK